MTWGAASCAADAPVLCVPVTWAPGPQRCHWWRGQRFGGTDPQAGGAGSRRSSSGEQDP